MSRPTRSASTSDAPTIPRTWSTPTDEGSSLALSVLFSPDPSAIGDVRALDEKAIGLGRRPADGGLAFQDPLASRLHATVFWDVARRRHVVRDEGSRNGTALNGMSVRTEVLEAGDVLRLGDTFVRFAVHRPSLVGWIAPEDCPLKGRSFALWSALDSIERVAATDLTVLVVGETGVGKGLAAREIHRRSSRRGAFVAQSCAAIPEHLMEDALFGHVEGAFTNARERKKGLVRSADRGTLFLDEIGELPFALQGKLLTVLEERQVRALGSDSETAADARFVCATNRDPARDVDEGRFRRDLYERIAQWTIRLLPLRERPDDLLAVVAHVVATHGGGRPLRLTGDFFEALTLYPWPGNFRQLVSVVRRALVLAAPDEPLDLPHLPERVLGTSTPTRPRQTGASEPPAAPPAAGTCTPTRRELAACMTTHGGNVSKVADELGRDRKQIYRWLRDHGLAADAFRPHAARTAGAEE